MLKPFLDVFDFAAQNLFLLRFFLPSLIIINFPTKKGQIQDPGQCFFGLGSGNSARNRPDPDQWFLWVWIRKKSDSDWIRINGFLIGLDPKKIDRFDRIQINGS